MVNISFTPPFMYIRKYLFVDSAQTFIAVDVLCAANSNISSVTAYHLTNYTLGRSLKSILSSVRYLGHKSAMYISKRGSSWGACALVTGNQQLINYIVVT